MKVVVARKTFLAAYDGTSQNSTNRQATFAVEKEVCNVMQNNISFKNEFVLVNMSVVTGNTEKIRN